MSTEPPLHHQAEDIAWAHQVQRGLLANQPGTGKSRSAIEATAGADKVLVVAPGLVINGGTWDDELQRWSSDPSKYTVAPYSMLNARTRTEAGGNSPVKALRPEFKGEFQAVIVDEAHYTKGRKTSWTWAVEQIANRADMVIEMTGTPIPNWAHELFTILRVINPEEQAPGKKYGSFWRWAGEWFDTSPTMWSNGKPSLGEMKRCYPVCYERPADDPCDHYREFTNANLGAAYRRVLRKDCLDLPPCTFQEVHVELSTAAKRIYRQLKKEFVTEVSGQEVIAWSTGSKNVLLDKITTSPWLLAPEGDPRGGKLDMLRFDLEARTMPTLVLAHYRQSVEACARVAELAGKTVAYVHGGTSPASDSEAVRRFKKGTLDVLVGSLETLSEGLTLTAADMAIFVEKSFKPSRNEQARYRIDRLGQTRPVTILEYVTPGTVDWNKRALLAVKNDRQMRTLTAAQFAALL